MGERILVRSRSTGHTYDLAGLWLKPQSQIHRPAHIHLCRHACYVWRQKCGIHFRRALNRINYGNARKNLLSMAEEKAQRKARHRHDQINFSACITLTQVAGEIGFMLRRRETSKIEILGEPLEPRRNRGRKRFSQTLFRHTNCGQIQPLAIKNEYILLAIHRLALLCRARLKSATYDNAEQNEKYGVTGTGVDAVLVHEGLGMEGCLDFLCQLEGLRAHRHPGT